MACPTPRLPPSTPYAPPEGATCVAEPPLAPFTGAAAVLCVALGAALAWGAVGGGSGAVKAAVVGAGAVEYAWGKANKQKFRRDINDRVAAHLHKNIVKCFSRLEKFLPLARIRKFARKTRAYRRAYREGKPNSLADVEKLVKGYKSHRSADVFDKKFCHADN